MGRPKKMAHKLCKLSIMLSEHQLRQLEEMSHSLSQDGFMVSKSDLVRETLDKYLNYSVGLDIWRRNKEATMYICSKVTPSRVHKAWENNPWVGFCVRCGHEHFACEKGDQKVTCQSCKGHTVYHAVELMNHL